MQYRACFRWAVPNALLCAASFGRADGCQTDGVRLSEFWRLMDDEFGSGYSRVLARSHAIHALNDRSADEALEDGVGPREVWRTLCVDLEVPPERWLGRDLPIAETKEP